MTPQTIQWIVIALVVLAQAVLTALKIIEKRNGKGAKTQTAYKFNPHPPGTSPACIKNGERIAKLEEGVENIEHRLDRIENKINGAR